MILNLINTIAIAFSIGTSVNNTSFNYERKAHKNAVEQINITKTFEKLSDYHWGANDEYANEKYIIDNNQNYNYYANYLSITNTVYANSTYNSTGQINQTYGIFKITNFYNSLININMLTKTSYMTETGISYYNKLTEKTYSNIDEIFNLTTTSTTQQRINQILSDIEVSEVYYNPNGSYTNTALEEVVDSLQYNNIELQPNETVYIIMIIEIQRRDIGNILPTRPTEITITGNATLPTVNYEVVNIPELMFTILTLPFSFISQAFNLTIFPNTPYQINFSNLFRTIIAIFILLWLIKHIFK